MPGSEYGTVCRTQRVVLVQPERHGRTAIGLTALAREVPAVASGLCARESPRRLVDACVQLGQDVPLGTLSLLATTGHMLRYAAPSTACVKRKTVQPAQATRFALRKSSAPTKCGVTTCGTSSF